MLTSLPSFTALLACFAAVAQADYDPALVGTWTTKSKAVLTGPGFYNPVADKLIEPALTGISYSFTNDGYYEEAYYRAVSNPGQPACPSGVMQWQHGRYSLPGNGSIILEPFAVDGRQLTSTPCSYSSSLYIRYHQPELFIKYETLVDPFHNVQRLNLYQFDGSPMNPMFLAMSPPQMLPTQTLNPTAAATTAGSAATSTSAGRRKRNLDGTHEIDGVLQDILGGENYEGILKHVEDRDAEKWWWAGLAMVGVGTVLYLLPTSK